MPNLDERFRIIYDMMGLFMQNVNEDRVKGYLRHLKPVPTDRLRAACAGCVEHGSQRGAPTVAEILRRAGDLGTRRLMEAVEPSGPGYVECKKVVHKTRYGPLLCCREEGHMSECEVWFYRNGPQAGDIDTIAKLKAAEGKVVPLRQPDALLEEMP